MIHAYKNRHGDDIKAKPWVISGKEQDNIEVASATLIRVNFIEPNTRERVNGCSVVAAAEDAILDRVAPDLKQPLIYNGGDFLSRDGITVKAVKALALMPDGTCYIGGVPPTPKVKPASKRVAKKKPTINDSDPI